jgi:hypothetical protein
VVDTKANKLGKLGAADRFDVLAAHCRIITDDKDAFLGRGAIVPSEWLVKLKALVDKKERSHG